MSKIEAVAKIFEGENGPVIAGIGGIMFLIGCHYLSRNHYRVEVKNDKKNFTLEPAVQATKASTDDARGAAE